MWPSGLSEATGMLNHHCAAAAGSAQSDSLPMTAANLCNRAHKGGGSPGSEGSCTQQAQVRDAVHRRESRRRDCHTAIEQRCRLKSFAFLAPVQSRDRSDTASVHRSPTRGESTAPLARHHSAHRPDRARVRLLTTTALLRTEERRVGTECQNG